MRSRLRVPPPAAAWIAAMTLWATAPGLQAQSGSGGFSSSSRPWVAPQWVQELENPIEVEEASIARGRELFMENCSHCHGEKGLGDGPSTLSLNLAAKNIATAEWSDSISDGEIFWKITTGRLPMEGFEDLIEEEDRWRIVNFVRTLAQAEAAPGTVKEASPEATLYEIEDEEPTETPSEAEARSETAAQRSAAPEVESDSGSEKDPLIYGLLGALILGVVFAFAAGQEGPPPPLEKAADH